jgi:hypothetical protein
MEKFLLSHLRSSVLCRCKGLIRVDETETFTNCQLFKNFST